MAVNRIAHISPDKAKVRQGDRFASALGTVVFFGLLAAIPLAVIPYGTVDPWWESSVECVVFALTALWVLEVLCRGSWRIRGTRVLLPAAAITAYVFIQTTPLPIRWLSRGSSSLTFTIDHYQTLLTARKTLVLFLFLGLLLQHIPTIRRLRWLLSMIIAVGVASAIFGLVRQITQTSDSPGGFVLPFLFYGAGYGQFIYANAFAYLMEMTLGLIAGLVLGRGVTRNRILIYVAASLMVWTALVLSNSRGGLITLACEAIFVLFLAMNWHFAKTELPDQKSRLGFFSKSMAVRGAAIVLLLVTLALGVSWVGGERLAGKLAAKSDSPKAEEVESDTRKEIWRATWQLVRQRPVTGVGFGAYYLGITQHQLSSGNTKVDYAHNDYLDLAASGGLVGIVLAVWFLGTVIWDGWSSLRTRDPFRRAAALGAATGILGACVHSLVDFGLQVTGLAIVFVALIVILLARPAINSRVATLSS